MAQNQANDWVRCEKRLREELSAAEHTRVRVHGSAKLLAANLQVLRRRRESLHNTTNWDRLTNVLGLLKPVAIAADVLAEGLCIPSRTLWGSLGLVVEAVSGSRKYLDYVLHLYEDLLRRLPRVEVYSQQMLQSAMLRLSLLDVFELHNSLTVRCVKTFGRTSKPGILAKIRWLFDKHNFEHDLQRLDDLLRKVDEEAVHAQRHAMVESEKRWHAEMKALHDKSLNLLDDKAADQTSRPGHHARRFTVPWARNRFFTGRESILAEIDSHLAPNGEAAGSHQRAVAVCGLGGVGKTQIALEYAHLHKDDYKACFWVTCDVKIKIASAFSEMARVLNFPDRGTEQNLVNVMDWLKTTTDPWLLIFDNAEEPQSLEPFWPPSRNGCVLLTSQDTSWTGQETISHGINLRSLETNDGVKLLQGIFSRDKRTIAREAAEAIVYETGGLPLALRQIASFIVSRGMDPEDFITQYRERRSTKWLDGWDENTQQSYSRTLTTFLDFSYSKLSQPARSVLGVFCFLDADNVWADVLTGLSSGSLSNTDSPVYDENVRALCRHSLIYMDRNGKEVVFSIHRQVKRHLFDRLDDAQLAQGLQWITARLRHLFPRQVPWEEDLSDKNKECARYIPHVLGLSDALARTSDLAQDPTALAQLLLDGGIYLWSKRLLEDAKGLLDKSQLMWKMRGEDNVLLAEIFTIRAAVLADSGSLDEALDYFERAMDVLKNHVAAVRGSRSLGACDEAYLANAYNNLGAMYAQLADYDRARILIQVSLHIKEKLQRRNVPMSHLLCVSYQNLGNIHAQLGDLDEASVYFRKALDAGTVEKSTLRMALTYHNYGALKLEEAKLTEARELLETAYQLRVETLGDSQDTAATLHLLACCHHKSDDEASKEAARLLLVEAVRILRQRPSQLYKSRLARSLFKLALVLADMGHAEFAQHRDEAYELWKEINGGEVQVPESEEEWDACLPYV